MTANIRKIIPFTREISLKIGTQADDAHAHYRQRRNPVDNGLYAPR